MVRFVAPAFLSGVLALQPAIGYGADSTIPLSLDFPHPTIQNISVVWLIDGDDDNDGVVTVRYREVGQTSWRTGMALRRVPAGTNPTNGWTWANRHAGSVFDLLPDTTYEIELTLTDPDGGSTVETHTVSTRPVPAPMPGAPVKPVTPSTFASVAASAQPGDILELAAGSYPGFTFSRDGAPGQPIVLRSEGDAVIDGVVYLDNRRWVYLDNLTVNGRIRMNRSSQMAVTRCTVTIPPGAPEGQGRSGIVFQQESENNYIADNVVTGVATWQESLLGCCDAPFMGEGIELSGPGHVVMNNRVRGFRDDISLLEGDEAVDQWSIDILNNDLERAVDDGVEADYCYHNCRIMRNRVTNAFVGLSAQPSIGGPTYFVRNVMYNLILEAFKLHNGSTGDVILHNTVVKSGDALGIYAGNTISGTYTRNNLFIGGPGWTGSDWSSGSGRVIQFRDASDPDMDFDGCGSEDGTVRGRIGETSFDSLAQLQALTTETHAVEVSPEIFASLVAHPRDPFPARAIPDLRLAEGSAAGDIGLTIPGLNDDFLGAGPDLGAHEAGADLPVYGPREELPSLKVGDATVVEGDDGTVSLEFTLTLEE
jgi:hypothetical protein